MFTAFQTCGNVAQTVIRSLNSTDFHGSGYTSDSRVLFFPFMCYVYSMAIIYGVFSASNLITPSVVAIIGPQLSMFASGLFYSLFFGNLYIYFAWQGKTQISESDRRTVFIALTVISLVGTVLFFLIRQPDSENVLGEDESSDDQDLEVNE
ncbi:hypothetical protein GH733_011614 [Mirounga leonina]|nr:hypothetical protein GH733_011614 [Mirounga leonina]